MNLLGNKQTDGHKKTRVCLLKGSIKQLFFKTESYKRHRSILSKKVLEKYISCGSISLSVVLELFISYVLTVKL